MAALKWNLAKLFAALEGVGQYGVDPDPTGAGYSFVKATEMTFQPDAELIERPGMTGDLVRQAHVVGAKGGKLTFKLELKGSGTPAGDGTPAIASESSPILESVFGTVVRGQGTTIAAASGNGAVGTPLKVTSAAGLQKYMLVEVGGEQRFVTAIAGTDVTLDRALSAAPAAGVVLYASSLFKRANTGHRSLAFVAFRDSIQFTFLGCKASIALEGFNARGTPLLSVDVDVGSWSATAKGALPAAELAGITAVRAPVVKASPFTIDGAAVLVSGLDFNPGQNFVFQESTEAADNKSGIELVQAQPQGTFRPYYAAGNLSDYVSGAEKSLAFTCGDRTNGFGLYLPKVQYGQPTLEDRNGMVGEQVPFFVNDNGADANLALCVF